MKWICTISMLLALALLLSVPAIAAADLHTAYLTGYPDGTLRPEAPVTRAQLAVILLRLAEPVQEQSPVELGDVPRTHWAYEAAALTCETELMNVQPDGLFHPDDTVSAPELAWTLARLSEREAAAAVWPSLKEGWEAQEISFAAGAGWVMGLDGETFDPDAALTRARLAQILNGLLGRTPSALEDLLIGMPVFSDNADVNAWYFLLMQEAAVTHTAAQTGTHERWSGLA